MIEICTVGGFDEVGKNCTAIKVDDEVVLLDMGLQLDKYIAYTENEDLVDISPKELTKVGAIPDIASIEDWRKKVIAIIPSHAHLDHIGAIPFIGKKFNAPVICTPFTKAVLTTILKDEKINFKNKIKTLNPNSTLKLSKNITIEFIYMTHSTPQTVMIAVHTKYGSVLYANDFKFDDSPVLGQKPNYKRLKELGKKNVECLLIDSIYAGKAMKTPSEKVAAEMLKDVMLGVENQGKAILVTTFSSHIARLKSIIKYGRKLNRKIVFLGRSLYKYVSAAEDVGIVNFSKEVDLVKYSSQIKKKLKKLRGKEKKYIFVVTGHQGEEQAVLSKMANDILPFAFKQGDNIIFSCTTIPTPINFAAREELENKLRGKGVRIFNDIHVSGHASKEDQRDLINMVKPKHIIPAHVDAKMASAMADLAKEEGYKIGENVHIMGDGARLNIGLKNHK